MSFLLKLERYDVQKEGNLPCQGKHIVSQFDDISVTVYRTVPGRKRSASKQICDKSNGVEDHIKTRTKDLNANDDPSSMSDNNNTETTVTTECHNEENIYSSIETDDIRKNTDKDLQREDFVLLQTGFVRTMVDCEWGKRPEHEKILAITLKRDGFEELLRAYVDDVKNNQPTGDVKVDWNPDRSLTGDILNRYVPEIGIRGNLLHKFKTFWILNVKDISEYVERSKRFIETGQSSRIWTPTESIYVSELSDACSTLVADIEECAISPETNLDLMDIGSLTETLAEVFANVKTSDLPHASSDTREAILYLYGSFNPIHMGHVNAVVEGKRWLETTGKYDVCATSIALTSDSNIKDKFPKPGDLRFKFEHRRKLCELACSDYPWIKIYQKEIPSQTKFGELMRKELNKPDATLAVLLGSDRAYLSKRRVRNIRSENKFVLCIGRKGMSPIEKKPFKEAEENSPSRSLDFFVVPTELNDISSTSVRQKVSQIIENNAKNSKKSTQNLRIIKKMIAIGWIAEKEGHYILQHINDMFF